jgi:hypothetical protein
MKAQPMKQVTSALLIGLALAVSLVWGSSESLARDVEGPRDRLVREIALSNATGDARGMIEVFRVWKLTKALDLSDGEMPGFVARLERLDERRMEAVAEERKALEEIQRLLDSKSAGDAELAEALARYEDARERGERDLRQSREELVSNLSPRQRCAFTVFERDFRQDMRQMIDRARLARSKHWGDDFWRRLKRLERRPHDKAGGRSSY